MALPDLITLDFALSALTEIQLDANQTAYLPSAITAASGVVRNWCDQNLTEATYDHILRVTTGQFAFPLEYPLNSISRCMTGLTTALTIQQMNTSTVAWATVNYNFVGTQADGQGVTGIVLQYSSNGATTTNTILWTALSPPTIQSLANAVNGLGNGWLAQVQGQLAGWAVTELSWWQYVVQDGLQGAYLGLYASGVQSARIGKPGDFIDLRYCALQADTNFQTLWMAGGAYTGGDDRIRNPSIRVVYDAGFALDAIPLVLQQVTVEVVKCLLERLQTDMSLTSESDGSYSWAGVGPEVLQAVPAALRQQLVRYRKRRLG